MTTVAVVGQKDVRQATRHVLIRCDGNSEIGLGHVYRCLAIASALRDHHGCAVRFAVHSGPEAVNLIKERDFVVLEPEEEDELLWLRRLVDDEKTTALLVDVRRGLDEAAIRSLRRADLFVAVLDDQGDRRLAADAVFYPPVSQVATLQWPRSKGRVYTGWEWIPLRRQFGEYRWQGIGDSPTLLICLGGGDPSCSMASIIEATATCRSSFSLRLLLGRALSSSVDARLQDAQERCGREVEIYRDIDEVAPVIASSSLAVLSFGGVAYEAAAMGVPALHLSLTEDHLQSAALFVREGMARSLGLISPLPIEALCGEIDRLLSNPKELDALSLTASSMLDAGGARRIADVLVNRSAKE